jgi:5'-3' exonuclease
MRPLLVIDGDSFAHRAYHALPKSIRRGPERRPAGALVGFSNMLIRLWEAEQPRTVLVAWDTLEVPTYRHEAFDSYQSGRVFDQELLEQLALLPELVASYGFAVAKGAGYEADDFLAAATDAETGHGGQVLVATSDRDAFQLAAENVTILQPTKAGSTAGKAGGARPEIRAGERPQRGATGMARIGPAEVRERYGVEPQQVPDFIALRGDPSDKLPGARGVGPKTAAQILGEYGSLEAALEAGRFAAEADALRLYRQIAQLDHSAPLPPLPDAQPDWARAAKLAGDWGMGALAGRLEERESTS